ncbi:oxidative stress defense protein [Shewanella sp. Choline-02u-19]|uniref:oxidative stress defense protein n=1 Tax=unclassified Shewanella TaxID=196818 RepID=UPI000C340916|nr:MULTISPECIES: oxidative stress defense protein [unclassified Shewanella]PKH55569.1 oxidative stress defense protein [Shewanella sp. Bg11-22]PKI29957.1 oxidative stress defense protein [Shewanella sp. Choline-02u-19]
MIKSSLAALISALVLSASITAPALAADISFAHLETIGTSNILAEADMAEINVEVVIKAETAKAAKVESDIAVAKFIERLEKAGVSSKLIQSANINLQPQYHYEKDQPNKLIGYSASRRVTVTVVDLTNLNSILDTALEEGINRINHIALKSSKEAHYLQQARLAAIKDAQHKAAELAQGFGEELDGVWQIRYFDQRPVQPVMMRMNAESDSYNVPKSYQQGQVTIQDRVEVTYRLK